MPLCVLVLRRLFQQLIDCVVCNRLRQRFSYINYCYLLGKVRRKSLGHNWKTFMLGTVKNQEKFNSLLPNKLLRVLCNFHVSICPGNHDWWCDIVWKMMIWEVHSLSGVAFTWKRFAIISSLCHFSCVFCFVLSHFSTMVFNTFYLLYFKCSWLQ